MKRVFSLVLVVVGAVFFFALSAHAQDQKLDFEQMSETVQVKSYIYTKNDQIRPHVRGSGTLVTPNGYIVTNNHVIERDEQRDVVYDVFTICMTSEFQSEPVCEFTASLVARHKEMDIAILKLHETDIRGNDIPALPFLPYKNDASVSEGDEIEVIGFPGIGLKTVTFTNGQVSGFDTINGFEYVKTDTVIAPGNSGGTARDEKGNFVGVPTYGVSTFGSSLGYFLDIREAVSWIDEHLDDEFEFDAEVHDQMGAHLRLRNDARREKEYVHPYEPSFRLRIPQDWDFSEIDRFSLVAESENGIKDYEFSVRFQQVPFELTREYLEETLFPKIERNKEERYKSYEREAIEFQGHEAYHITHSFQNQKSENYFVLYGDSIFFLNFVYDIRDEKEDKPVYEQLLLNFSFEGEPSIADPIREFTDDRPAFSIETAKGWYLSPNVDPASENSILEFVRSEPTQHQSEIKISHMELSESDKTLPNEEFLKNIVQNHESSSDFRLLSKSDDIVADGLSGVSLTYTYQGDELNETKKITKVYLRDGDDYYFIRFDALDADYDEFLPDFKQILGSFKNLSDVNPATGEYRFGSFDAVFADIQHHRYESEITRLKDENIISGYPNGTFAPEKSVSRAEALKMLLEAKVLSEEKNADTQLADELQKFAGEEFANLDFSDTKEVRWLRKYVRYAREHEIVSGYENDEFRPKDTVSLAEALKMIYGIYEIPVWDPDGFFYASSIAWHKPLMDKGYDLRIIPRGLDDKPGHLITRGEMAYIIARFLERERG